MVITFLTLGIIALFAITPTGLLRKYQHVTLWDYAYPFLGVDDLVRKSGVKHTALTKIEGDFVRKPSVQVIAKIAKALDIAVEDLLK